MSVHPESLLLLALTALFLGSAANAQADVSRDPFSGRTVHLQIDAVKAAKLSSQFKDAEIEVEREQGLASALRLTPPAPEAGPPDHEGETPDHVLSGFDRFRSAEATAAFGFLDKAVWTSQELFKRRALDGIVVMNAYPLETVCGNRRALEVAGPLLSVHGASIIMAAEAESGEEALFYDIDTAVEDQAWIAAFTQAIAIARSRGDGSLAVATAVTNPLDPVCAIGATAGWAGETSWSGIVDLAEDWTGGSTDFSIVSGPELVDDASLSIVLAQEPASYWTLGRKGDAGAMLSADLYGLAQAKADAPQEARSGIHLLTIDAIPGIDPATQVWAR